MQSLDRIPRISVSPGVFRHVLSGSLDIVVRIINRAVVVRMIGSIRVVVVAHQAESGILLLCVSRCIGCLRTIDRRWLGIVGSVALRQRLLQHQMTATICRILAMMMLLMCFSSVRFLFHGAVFAIAVNRDFRG